MSVFQLIMIGAVFSICLVLIVRAIFGRRAGQTLLERASAGTHTAAPAPPSPMAIVANAPLIADKNVRFTVYRPNEVEANVWHTMLAFCHLAERSPESPADQPDPVEQVRQQAQAILGDSIRNYPTLAQDAAHVVPRSGELTFVPEMGGIEFDPPRCQFQWNESIHRETFLLRASSGVAGRLVRGRLAVFLGTLLLGDVPLSIRVTAVGGATRRSQMPPASNLGAESATRYRRIFASYCHRDADIVREFESYARTLGDDYLRDVAVLRSGEVWGQQIEALIDSADVFQLFWSWRSIDSPFVRREWEHALQLGRPGFVRPVYWEDPLPSRPEQNLPPDGLSQLHFQRLPRIRDSDTADTSSRRGTLWQPEHATATIDRISIPEAGPARVAATPIAEPPSAEKSAFAKKVGGWDTDRGAGTVLIDTPVRVKAASVDDAATSDISLPYLYIVSGQRGRQRIQLQMTDVGRSMWTIGSRADQTIQLADDGVATEHAKLSFDGGHWVLTDIITSNGTYVNGKRVPMAWLIAGDRLQFGPVECVFHVPKSHRVAARPRSVRTIIVLTLIALLVIYLLRRRS